MVPKKVPELVLEKIGPKKVPEPVPEKFGPGKEYRDRKVVRKKEPVPEKFWVLSHSAWEEGQHRRKSATRTPSSNHNKCLHNVGWDGLTPVEGRAAQACSHLVSGSLGSSSTKP